MAIYYKNRQPFARVIISKSHYKNMIAFVRSHYALQVPGKLGNRGNKRTPRFQNSQRPSKQSPPPDRLKIL